MRAKSSKPCILDVAQLRAGRDEDHVNADILAVGGIGCCQCLGGSGDARKAAFVDREIEFGGGRADLHFDESDQPLALGDQIDFADFGANPLGDDRPAEALQVRRRQRLALAPARLGGLAISVRFASNDIPLPGREGLGVGGHEDVGALSTSQPTPSPSLPGRGV